MLCPNCNSQFPDGANFCPYCAVPLNDQFNQNPNMNPQPNQQYNQQYNQPPYHQQPNAYGYNPNMQNPDDQPSTALNVIAFFVPIVGLILYLLWKDQYPRKAKKIGKAALISFIIGVVFYTLYFIGIFAFTFTSGMSMFEYMM